MRYEYEHVQQRWLKIRYSGFSQNNRMCVKWKVSQRLHIMMCPFLRMWNPCILARPARPALSLPSREEALLTSLLFWPQAPKIRLGQTAMTKDEGFEEALFYQPPFLATGTHPSPVLESAEAWRKRLQAPSSFAGSETKLAWYFCPISLIPELGTRQCLVDILHIALF